MVKAAALILCLCVTALAIPARAGELPNYTEAQMCGHEHTAGGRMVCLKNQGVAKRLIQEFVHSGERAGSPRLLASCIETAGNQGLTHESAYSAIKLCLFRARHAWQIEELRSRGLIPTDRCDDRVENCTTLQKAALSHLLRGDFPIDDQRFDACLDKTLAGRMDIVWMGFCAKDAWVGQIAARGTE